MSNHSFRTLASFLAPWMLVPIVAACGEASDSSPSPADPDPSQVERGPIGKADQSGSCQGYCGGQSAGKCWCDDLCESYGDCCDDKGAVCDGEQPYCPDGQVDTTTVFTEASNGMECSSKLQHCVTTDASACPQLSPLPPDYCQDGEIVSGGYSYVASTDGMECKIPRVHCVTTDWSQCPLLSPLPPDYCSDGHIVEGDPTFVPSADGKECRIPSVHCVTDDAAACEPAFCQDGTIVAETAFAQGPGEFECTQSDVHCITYEGCPLLTPLPPYYCADGDIVTGEPTYIAGPGGMECQMPSVHCVTRDLSACPLFTPLPPDYCADGEIVQGPSSFVPSTDGMECEIPSVHCVSGPCQ